MDTTYDSTADTLKHIKRVNELLIEFAMELLRRAAVHDTSKLEDPEKPIFDQFTDKLKTSTYGSEEYKGFLKAMKPALDHHYANNSHHPEHYAEKSLSPEDARIDEYLFKYRGEVFIDNGSDVREILVDHLQTHRSRVNNMDLADIVEMLIDWKAAGERHDDGSLEKSIVANKVRFGLSDQLADIFRHTGKLLVKVKK